jgi:hypothetical protein
MWLQRGKITSNLSVDYAPHSSASSPLPLHRARDDRSIDNSINVAAAFLPMN